MPFHDWPQGSPPFACQPVSCPGEFRLVKSVLRTLRSLGSVSAAAKIRPPGQMLLQQVRDSSSSRRTRTTSTTPPPPPPPPPPPSPYPFPSPPASSLRGLPAARCSAYRSLSSASLPSISASKATGASSCTTSSTNQEPSKSKNSTTCPRRSGRRCLALGGVLAGRQCTTPSQPRMALPRYFSSWRITG